MPVNFHSLVITPRGRSCQRPANLHDGSPGPSAAGLTCGMTRAAQRVQIKVLRDLACIELFVEVWIDYGFNTCHFSPVLNLYLLQAFWMHSLHMPIGHLPHVWILSAEVGNDLLVSLSH